MQQRIAYFGSGSPLSVIVFRELIRQRVISAVVTPRRRLRHRDRLKKWLGRLPVDPLTVAAREHGITATSFDADGTAGALRSLGIDLIVIATFPTLLPPPVLTAARRGGVNLHQSLLPRLRGPDPLFWSYYEDDRETGTTVHWLDEGVDSGDIIAQESVPIGRGQSIVDLYFTLAERGATQLSAALDAVADGTARRRSQDSALATHRPCPLKTPWPVAFDRWGAERTWHFISGTADMFGMLFRDPTGAPLPMGRARNFSIEEHGREPGTHEWTGDGVRLFCPDGVVEVSARQR